jgi:outer membrane protein TolC
MNKTIIIILLLLSVSDIHSQSVDALLVEIEKHNTELNAARKLVESQTIHLKSTNTPGNPEVEYGFFPGNTDAIGTKKVFGISQRFEFPTVYNSRKRFIEGQKSQLKFEYQIIRRKVLTNAKAAVLSYVFHRKALETNLERLRWNKALESDMRKRHESGDLPLIDIKKASMQVMRLENEVSDIKRKLAVDSLVIMEMNGNVKLETDLHSLDFPGIKNLAEEKLIIQYVESHPEIHLQAARLETSGKLIALRKQEYFPDIKIGYESEQVMSDIHRGISAGIEIPLWGKKHTIDAARKRQDAIAAEKEASKISIIKSAERKIQNLKAAKETYLRFNSALQDYNSPELLKEAHSKGYLSSTELFMELDYFYQLKDDLLKTQYRLLKTQAELTAFEL